MRKITSLGVSSLLMTTGLISPVFAQELDFQIDDEIVVRGVNVPNEKRATSEISALLTPEKLERQGDSDIAEALRRVTGLSLSQGKFIVVRGLNERYSNLTLNGSALPSPEPLRRVAPLDLFPTTVVETALVQKTFSPEYSGEFGGGLIELRSKGVPNEGFLELKIGLGLNTVSTARNGLTYEGGDFDFLGFDDGTRNVPSFLAGATAANAGIALRTDTGVIDASQAQQIGQEFVNAELRVIEEGSTPVNHNANISGGQRWDLDSGVSLGFVASGGYSRSFQTKEGQQGDAGLGANGEAVNGDEIFDFTSTTEEVLTNGLLAFGIEFDDNHSLDLTGIVLRKSTKEARQSLGTETASFGGFDQVLVSNLEFFENQVWSVQGNSEHIFPVISDLTLSLRGAYSQAYREAPYETEYVYVNDGFTVPTSGDFFRSAIGLGSGASASGFNTDFSQVDDTSYSGGIDLELPLFVFNRDITLKTGYAYNNNQRDYILRSFGFANRTGLPDNNQLFFQSIDLLLSDRNLSDNGFEFIEFSDQIQPQAYTGQLDVHGAYFGSDIQVNDFIRAAFGVRYETGEQIVDNFNVAGINSPIPNDGTPEAVIDEDYFLPAVTITWNPFDNIQLRGAFSQTITRPQFQEIGDAFFTDTDRDIQVIGNPALKNTETMNIDFRAEWYFGREQYITLGAFYKDLKNPIEESLVNTGDDINTTYINAPAAELFGIEFEYEQRFELGQFLTNGYAETKDLIISANYTWSTSRVGADGIVTVNVPNGGFQTGPASNFFVDGRSLQGQSDHLANFQIGYEDYEVESKLFILVNWTSERIRQVGLITGGANVPNTVERLPLILDLVYSRNLSLFGNDGWSISGKIGNILNDRYEATADGADETSVAIDVYDIGTTFSLGLKKRF